MRALVFTEPGRLQFTRDLEVRRPGPGEVLVRIVASGLCHSDLSVVNGTIPWPAPAVLGHEGAGIVERVGTDVTSLAPGDHVVLHTLAYCGTCSDCEGGHPTHCRSTLGNRSSPFVLDGVPVANFAATSSFAEFTIVKTRQAVKIPSSIPLDIACLLGCGVLTGIGAVLNRATVDVGDTAAVFGVGGVGLNVIQGLVLAGATRIIAVDRLPAKRALALSFGATDFVDAAAGDAAMAIRSILPFSEAQTTGPMGSGGVKWAFECTGSTKALTSALAALDWGGTCVIVGVPPSGATIELPINTMAYVDRAILGCRYGSAQPHQDISRYLDLYGQGRLKLDELVSRRYPIERFEDAFADLEAGILARGVLTF